MRTSVRFSIAALILAAIGAVAGFAQTATSPFSAPWYFATSFQLWSINGQSPNTYIFQGRSLCNSAGQNLNFFDFATNAPVLIADANTANSEVKTPSAIVNTAGSCGVTIAPSNNHYNFLLKSGTAGLQEGINVLDGQGAWPALLILDKNWWTIANQIPGTYATAILGAAKGDASVIVADITTLGPTYYVWNGTAYASGTWVNTAPTLAAGASAGAGPTVANASTATALAGIAGVKTGTATTTGTLFTETWATSAQFAAAPICTVVSSGANSFTAFTVATSYGSSHGILTVTVPTTAPAVSTQYYFTYNCK
jgi:hypothetical protein